MNQKRKKREDFIKNFTLLTINTYKENHEKQQKIYEIINKNYITKNNTLSFQADYRKMPNVLIVYRKNGMIYEKMVGFDYFIENHKKLIRSMKNELEII